MSKESKTKADGLKLNYKRTFLIGFGFMACMLLWNVYNSYVPVIFRAKLSELTNGGKALPGILSVALLVNAIMTIDNVFGVIFQPYFGKKSDHMRSKKWGKRMPFIILCLPICAVFFSLIPLAALQKSAVLSIILMMTVIIFFNFLMSIWRSPVVSLMPDFTPSALQSDANAVINIMGGVGQMIGLVMGTIATLIVGVFGFTALHDNLSAKTDTMGRVLETVEAEAAPITASKGATPRINYYVLTADGLLKEEYAEEVIAFTQSGKETLYWTGNGLTETKTEGAKIALAKTETDGAVLYTTEVPDLLMNEEATEKLQNFVDSSRDKLYLNGDHISGEYKENSVLLAEKIAKTNADGSYVYVNYFPVFVIAAIIAVLCLIVLIAFYLRNKKFDLSDAMTADAEPEEKQKKIKIRDLPISKEERRSLIVMLAALFLINNATEAIVPNFTNFALDTLNMPPTSSTLMMAVFAVSLAAFGIPAGTLGRKIGRKKTIIMGLSVIVAMFAVYLAVSQLFAGSQTFVRIVLWIALVVGGAAVGCININTLPLVLTIGGREYVGTFTGYYYTATFSAAITGPILCGGLIGLFNDNYNYMFLFCAIFFALGLLVITQVKHGEAYEISDEEIKQAQMADD